MNRWDDVVALHRRAAAEYAAAARQLAADDVAWITPPVAGKWSAAEITQHLILVFEAVGRELRGGVPMVLRTRAWHRFVLRFTIQRRLLAGGPFPRGARAPREARPQPPGGSAAALVERFERLHDELLAELETAFAERPRLRLTHPYFGRLGAVDTVCISARHIQHHATQLHRLMRGAGSGSSEAEIERPRMFDQQRAALGQRQRGI
jgi:hypothetical protein